MATTACVASLDKVRKGCMTRFFLAILLLSIPIPSQAGMWTNFCSWLLTRAPTIIDPALLTERPYNYLIAETQKNETVLLINDVRIDPAYAEWAKETDDLIAQHRKEPTLKLVQTLTKHVFDGFQNPQMGDSHENLRQQKRNDKKYLKITGETAVGTMMGNANFNQVTRLRIGDLLLIRRAECRHRSALLAATLSKAGLTVRLMSGKIFKHARGDFVDSIKNMEYYGGHSWVEAEIDGRRYVFDPMNLHLPALNGFEVKGKYITFDFGDDKSVTYFPNLQNTTEIRSLRPGEPIF